MIIDFHTHCFSDEIAPAAMANLCKDSLYPPHYNGMLAGLKQSMAEAEIDISVVLNIATNARQNIKVNDWAIFSNAQKGIVSFGSIHPDFSEYKAELMRLKSNGIKGIKFHPDYQGFIADSPKMYPIYSEIEKLGLVMTFHCGNDLIPRSPLCSTPEMLLHIASDFPNAKIVGAHLGGQGLWEDVFKHLVGKNIYLDTSFGFKYLSKAQIERFIKSHPNDRILFASDAPWQKQSVEVAEMRTFIANHELLEKIFYRNAVALLNL